MEIAICDDCRSDLEYTLRLIKNTNIEVNVHTFHSAAKLFSSYVEGLRPDVIFLDIEMEEPNGFEIAHKLKDNNCAALIVFLTVTEEYAVDGYEVAWRYNRKPIQQDEVNDLLHKAQKIVANKIVQLQSTEGKVVIPVKDVLYVEVRRNTVHVHTLQNKHQLKLTMREAEKIFDSIFFAKPHTSFIINLLHLEEIKSAEVIMNNGHCIPIARGRKENFWAVYRNYLRWYS